MATKKVDIVKEGFTKFSKSRILKASKYVKHRDLLNALLEDEKEYAFCEVDDLIKDFLGKRVD